MSPILSVCIPTFNRKEWLRGCIRAIQREVKTLPPGLVEIVVSNNASTDGTRVYLDAIAGPDLVVHHNEISNFMGNFETVCQYATGEFCWLMGDDDEPLPGSIQKVLEALASGADWYFPEKLVVEGPNRSKSEVSLYDLSAGRSTWDLCDPSEVKHWADSAQSLTSLGGLLSVMVGRREALLRGFEATRDWGNASMFPHVAAFLHASEDDFHLEIVPGSTALYRNYNDNLGQSDPWERIMLDLRAVLAFADMQVPSGQRFMDEGRDAFLAIIRRHHGFRMLPTLSMLRDTKHPWEEAEYALRAVGYSEDAIAVARNILVRLQHAA